MSLRGTWYVIKQSVPTPAWIRLPGQQRFCLCCSIRTGAAVVGWFNFIVNSLYVGMLLLAMTQLRNLLDESLKVPSEFKGTVEDMDEFSGSVPLPTRSDITAVHHALDPELEGYMREMILNTLPIMYKSVAIPAIMIIFSVLWLVTVEAKNISLVRLFGRAFMLATIVQLLSQLGFLIYVDIKSRTAFGIGISWIVWVVFAVYAVINIYFLPILSEYIKRRIRECDHGMEQGLLTSEMYPRARVAEEYIQDAFTLDADLDMVQFQASLAKQNSTEEKNDTEPQEIQDDHSPI